MSKPEERRAQWRQRIKEQEQSGISVRRYCGEHGIAEHAFYSWRRRFRTDQPVSFALVESRETAERPAMLELVCNGGERLLIPCKEAAVRLVLGVLRIQP